MRHVVICFNTYKKIAADYGSNVNLFDILSIHKKEWALVQKDERDYCLYSC